MGHAAELLVKAAAQYSGWRASFPPQSQLRAGGPAVARSAMWDGCADATHDAGEVGKVAIIKGVAEHSLQESVVALAGLRGHGPASWGDGGERGAGVAGVGVAADEPG